jgi:hypothetical protein
MVGWRDSVHILFCVPVHDSLDKLVKPLTGKKKDDICMLAGLS